MASVARLDLCCGFVLLIHQLLVLLSCDETPANFQNRKQNGTSIVCFLTDLTFNSPHQPETGPRKPQTLFCSYHQPPSSGLCDLCKLQMRRRLSTSVQKRCSCSGTGTDLTAEPERSVLAPSGSAGTAWPPASLEHKPGAGRSAAWSAAPSGSGVQRGNTLGTPATKTYWSDSVETPKTNVPDKQQWIFARLKDFHSETLFVNSIS